MTWHPIFSALSPGGRRACPEPVEKGACPELVEKGACPELVEKGACPELVEGYEGNGDWVEGTLLEMSRCLNSGEMPQASEGCEYCAYRVAARGVE